VSRSAIDQAKGILMAARGLSAEEAFTELTRQSQQENIKVRDLAARFVEKVTRSATDSRSRAES
jgi:AmiR/NasT family two-component response regulator